MSASSLQSIAAGEVDEKAVNGAKWHALLEVLLQLRKSFNQACAQNPGPWVPDISPYELLEDACDAWRDHESGFLDQIHSTAREWVRTRRLPNLPSEVLYYLGLRHQAALNFVETSFLSTERGQSSLIPFPSVSLQGFAEWLLIEWADTHVIYLAFPEMTQS